MILRILMQLLLDIRATLNDIKLPSPSVNSTHLNRHECKK